MKKQGYIKDEQGWCRKVFHGSHTAVAVLHKVKGGWAYGIAVSREDFNKETREYTTVQVGKEIVSGKFKTWNECRLRADEEIDLIEVPVRNLMSGKLVLERMTTPNCCSVSSETYWSM